MDQHRRSSRRRNRTDQGTLWLSDVRAALFGLLGKDVTDDRRPRSFLSAEADRQNAATTLLMAKCKAFYSWLGLATSQ